MLNGETGPSRIGEICKQLKALANTYKIPVLTANHLGRTAIDKVQENRQVQRMDHAKSFNASMIADSSGLARHADLIAYIHVEETLYTPTGKEHPDKYMTVCRDKTQR